jgi:hypothetical protein
VPQTIDLVPTGVEADGTRVYDSPWNALCAYLCLLLLNHPKETFNAMGLMAVTGACLYFAYSADSGRGHKRPLTGIQVRGFTRSKGGKKRAQMPQDRFSRAG